VPNGGPRACTHKNLPAIALERARCPDGSSDSPAKEKFFPTTADRGGSGAWPASKIDPKESLSNRCRATRIGPPRRGARCGDLLDGNPLRRGRFLLEETDQGVEVRGEKILASEMGARTDALLDLVPFAIRFHQSEVFVVAIRSLAGAQEQRGLLMHYTYTHRRPIIKHKI